MSTIASRPLSLLRLDFADLYARHLCRHSQFGINVAHLAALFGTWYAVYAAVYWLVAVQWVPAAMAAAYLVVIATNVPVRVVVATAIFLVLFVASVLALPELPLWAYLVMIPLFYELQSWSHRLFTAERDMTEFNQKYPKGPALFVVLLFYEVPLVLNYLVFDRKSWSA
jgi:hypothetical protein